MGQPQAVLIYEDTLEQWGILYKGGVSEPEPGRSEEHSSELGCFSVIKSVLCPMAKFVVGICNSQMYRWLFTRDSQCYKEQEKALQNLREDETVKILPSTKRK